MLLSRATPTLSGQQVGSFTSVAATTMTANTGTISGVAHLTTIMGTGISDSLVLASSTTAASAAAVSNCWAGCVHTSGGVVSGTLAVSNLNVLGTYMTVNATEVVSSNMVVTNFGTGPALSVTQSETGVYGAQPVATFSAGSNVGLVVTNSGGVAVGKSTASYALDVSGVVSATSFVGSGALLTGISSGGSGAGMFKNRVVNGDMQINQYGIANGYHNNGAFSAPEFFYGAASSTGSTQTASTYVCDRFCVFRDTYAAGLRCTQGWYTNTIDGQNITYAATQQPFIDTGSLYYALIKRTASDTSTANINMRYAFELLDTYDIYNTTVTMSFYYKMGANFSGTALNYGFITGAAEGLQRGATSVTNTYGTTAAPSTSWVRVSYSTTLPSISTTNLYLGLYFYYTPSGTAGSADSIYITGVQLEKGSSMTSFEWCPYATKLDICQRYYKSFGTSDMLTGMNGSSSSMMFPLLLSPNMRIPPTTIIYPSGNAGTVSAYGVAGTATALTIAESTVSTALIFATCSSLTTNTGPLILNANIGSIGISAEM